MLVILTVVVAVAAADTGYIFPVDSSTYLNKDFLLTVSNIAAPILSCEIQEKGVLIVFDDNIGQDDKSLHLINDFEHGLCALKIQPVHQNHEGNWTFIVKDGSEKLLSFTTNLYVKWGPRLPNSKIIQTSLGTSQEIKCSETDVNAVYTEIYSPDQKKIYSGGKPKSIFLNPVKTTDFGVWTCKTLVSGMLEETVTNITLKAKPEDEEIKSGISESDTHLNLFCNYNFMYSLNYGCLFERPDGMKIQAIEGRELNRYGYFGAGAAQRECGISIKKPLIDVEYGIWKCYIAPTASGGFLTIHKTPDEKVPIPATSKALAVQQVEDEDLIIQCSARASLSYCTFKLPTGETYTVHPNIVKGYTYSGEGLSLGDCQVTIPGNATDKNMNGKWRCGMVPKNEGDGIDDLFVDIAVKIAEKPFTVNSTLLKSSVGSWSILGCHAVARNPLQYCRFTRPDGASIHVRSKDASQGKNGKYAYHGNGLNAGDCGLYINPVSKEDFGAWTCAALFLGLNEGKEYILTLHVGEDGTETSSASALGLGLGLGIAASVLAVGAVYMFIKKRRRPAVGLAQQLSTIATRQRASSTSSGSSSGTEVVITTQERPSLSQENPFSLTY